MVFKPWAALFLLHMLPYEMVVGRKAPPLPTDNYSLKKNSAWIESEETTEIKEQTKPYISPTWFSELPEFQVAGDFTDLETERQKKKKQISVVNRIIW